VNKALKYGFGAIALYLVVANGGKAAQVIGAGANGTATVTKAFQGRP
jgi:hypothetical protein